MAAHHSMKFAFSYVISAGRGGGLGPASGGKQQCTMGKKRKNTASKENNSYCHFFLKKKWLLQLWFFFVYALWLQTDRQTPYGQVMTLIQLWQHRQTNGRKDGRTDRRYQVHYLPATLGYTIVHDHMVDNQSVGNYFEYKMCVRHRIRGYS